MSQMKGPRGLIAGGKPKALTKQKVCNVYSLVQALQHVMIEPFNEQMFTNHFFQSYLNYCKDYCITKSSVSGRCIALLRFDTIDIGDQAMLSIKEALGDDVNVCHPEVETDQALTTFTHEYLDIHHYMRKQIGGIPPGLLTERSVLLENMPHCDQNEIAAEFDDVLNILEFTCDESVTDSVILELKSREQVQAFIQDRNGSLFKNNVICVSPLDKRIGILDQNHFVYHRHEEEGQTYITDMERLKNIDKALDLEKEKHDLMSSSDLLGLQKYYRFKEIQKEYNDLRLELIKDARRRHVAKQPLPEDKADLGMTEEQKRFLSGKGLFGKVMKKEIKYPTKRNFPTPEDYDMLQGHRDAKRFSADFVDDNPPHVMNASVVPQSEPKQYFDSPAYTDFERGPDLGAKKPGSGKRFPPTVVALSPNITTTAEERLQVVKLSQRVKELTEQAKAMGKDPDFKVQGSSGMGRHAQHKQKRIGNPVIQGLEERVAYLEELVNVKPKLPESVRAIQEKYLWMETPERNSKEPDTPYRGNSFSEVALMGSRPKSMMSSDQRLAIGAVPDVMVGTGQGTHLCVRASEMMSAAPCSTMNIDRGATMNAWTGTMTCVGPDIMMDSRQGSMKGVGTGVTLNTRTDLLMGAGPDVMMDTRPGSMLGFRQGVPMNARSGSLIGAGPDIRMDSRPGSMSVGQGVTMNAGPGTSTGGGAITTPDALDIGLSQGRIGPDGEPNMDAQLSPLEERALIVKLSQEVKALTEQVRKAGKNPDFAYRENQCLGKYAKHLQQRTGNPVIQGMRKRISDLQFLLDNGHSSAVHPSNGSNSATQVDPALEKEEMAYLTQKVSDLTEKIKAMGRDPSVKVVGSAGMGRHASEHLRKRSGNPVINGLRKRVADLEDIMDEIQPYAEESQE